MPVTDIISTPQAEKGFYPTPPSVASKMLDGLDLRYVHSVLEPSAGKGDLINAIARANNDLPYRDSIEVDFCEIDPYLRQICKYNFCGEKEHDIYEQFKPLQSRSFSSLSESEKQEYKRLDKELDVLRKTHVHCSNDDFLTYRTYKHYDLILMNPPFANGDKHLLRAIEMQQRQGGSIICLLNAETIRNPYTALRVQLAEKLKEVNADIQFIDDAFSDDAERTADVDVAVVRIHIEPPPPDESDIWERMKKAVAEDDIPDPELHALITGDYLEQAITLYRTEVAATMELVRQYKAFVPYMARKLNPEDSYDKMPLLHLVVGDDNYLTGFDIKKYMRTVRLKYWRALFSNKQFIGRLTSELQKKYYDQIEKMADYEFSAFNIKQVAVEMNSKITQGVEKAIMDLFEKLTYEHTYNPDFSNNRHYYNGWTTNQAHKIGKKCIIPTYGMFSSYSWHKEAFEVSTAYGVISDIEKAFDYLDGGRTDEIDLSMRLRVACDRGQTRNIECKYFKVDLFKKGTTHIKFYPEAMPLVDRLNIYASQKKGWLPPSYGKARYKDMAAAEKAVVDSFHGSGEEGSGAEEYAEVMANASFYLAEPTQNVPMLTNGT